MVSRTDYYAMLILLVISFTAFLFTDCCFSGLTLSKRTLARVTLLAEFTAPCVLPLAIMYLKKITKPYNRIPTPIELLWTVIPIILFTASLVLYLICGEESVSDMMVKTLSEGYGAITAYEGEVLYFYFIVSSVAFRAVMTVEILWFAVFIIILSIKEKYRLGNLSRYFFKGGSVKTSGLSVAAILPMYFLLLLKFTFLREIIFAESGYTIAYSILMAFFILCFAYNSIFASKEMISRKGMKRAFRYNYSVRNKSQSAEDMIEDLLADAKTDSKKRIFDKLAEELHIAITKSANPASEHNTIAEQVLSSSPESWGQDKMLDRFRHLMKGEKLFLQPRLTLDDVAEKLGTNKFYVSKLVNNTYDMGFPELINTLRVDYAEQYILKHRDAKQEEIARNCGFISASSFNTIFKKVTGTTPKVWLAQSSHHVI